MGVLAPWSAHTRPSAQPTDNMSGSFPAQMFADSPSYISYPKFRNVWIFKNKGLPIFFGGLPSPLFASITNCVHFHIKKNWKRPSFPIFFIGILLFLWLRNACKVLLQFDNPLWGISNQGMTTTNNNKMWKNTQNSGHLYFYLHPRAGHALCSDQFVFDLLFRDDAGSWNNG
jgi:hypothetical protein